MTKIRRKWQFVAIFSDILSHTIFLKAYIENPASRGPRYCAKGHFKTNLMFLGSFFKKFKRFSRKRKKTLKITTFCNFEPYHGQKIEKNKNAYFF